MNVETKYKAEIGNFTRFLYVFIYYLQYSIYSTVHILYDKPLQPTVLLF